MQECRGLVQQRLPSTSVRATKHDNTDSRSCRWRQAQHILACPQYGIRVELASAPFRNVLSNPYHENAKTCTAGQTGASFDVSLTLNGIIRNFRLQADHETAE